MIIQAGKRYIRRDGKVTGILTDLPQNNVYKFFDRLHNKSYTRVGENVERTVPVQEDLMEEYFEPTSINKIVSIHPSVSFNGPYVCAGKYNALVEAAKEVTDLHNKCSVGGSIKLICSLSKAIDKLESLLQ